MTELPGRDRRGRRARHRLRRPVRLVRGDVPEHRFCASPESARAYLAGHGGLDAQILDAGTAIEAGRLNFATLLTGPA
jgi:hypothetical protein